MKKINIRQTRSTTVATPREQTRVHLIPPDTDDPVRFNHYSLRAHYATAAALVASREQITYDNRLACSVPNPAIGKDLEYRHLSKGPEGDT